MQIYLVKIIYFYFYWYGWSSEIALKRWMAMDQNFKVNMEIGLNQIGPKIVH